MPGLTKLWPARGCAKKKGSSADSLYRGGYPSLSLLLSVTNWEAWSGQDSGVGSSTLVVSFIQFGELMSGKSSAFEVRPFWTSISLVPFPPFVILK